MKAIGKVPVGPGEIDIFSRHGKHNFLTLDIGAYKNKGSYNNTISANYFTPHANHK